MQARVRILHVADFVSVMELDQYSSLSYTRRWQDLDDFQLQFSAESEQGRRLFQNGVVPSRSQFVLAVYLDGTLDFVGFIDVCEGSLDSKRDQWTISGKGLDRILSDRIVLPPRGLGHDSYSGLAETIMKSLVDRQAVNPIASGILDIVDEKRSIPNLSIEADGHNGTSTSFDGRFQRLDQSLTEIAKAGGDLGFSVELSGSQMSFRVSTGLDRSNTAVFSIGLDNLQSFQYALDGLDAANVMIIAGQGQDENRTVIARGATGNGPMGLWRREAYLDARDLILIESLQARADSELQQRAIDQSFRSAIKPGTRPFYKQDWDLGDIVRIVNNLWSIDESVRIYEVTVSLSAGDQVQIVPQFSRQSMSLKDSVARVISASQRN